MVIAFKQGATTNQPYIEVIRNPTTGTIISSEVIADQISNSDFSSSKVLKASTLIYKGASGETFTDGTVHATLGGKLDSRGFYVVPIKLGRGSSIGIKIYPDLSSGNVECYAAFIGHIKDIANKE
jgi:hypothetical protein